MERKKGHAIKIPNFNTISTLIDRLTIENVKLSHFQYLMENSEIKDKKEDLLNKISIQENIIGLLKQELENYLLDLFQHRNYEYIDEERTFT